MAKATDFAFIVQIDYKEY